MTFNLSSDLEITCNGEQMEQLTKWGKPGARMSGVRGCPAYEKWLRDEKRRLKKDTLRQVKIVKHPERPVVSLWVDMNYERIGCGVYVKKTRPLAEED